MDIQFTPNITEDETKVSHVVPRRRWDRWLYIAILVVLFGSLLKWLIYPCFFDLSEGILLQQQYDINFAEDIRILEYHVEDGNEVKVGDTLFVYELQNNTYPANQDSISLMLDRDKDRTLLIELNAEIEKRQLFIWQHKKRLRYWQSEKNRKEQLVYLNAITPNELANVDRSIDDVSSQIATLNAEYAVLIKQRKQISNYLQSRSDMQYKDMQLKSSHSYFVSPVEGQVDRLRTPLNQINYKKDIVASIIRPEYIVRAYIDIDRLNDFRIGDMVSIILPYRHTKLEGEVAKVYMVSEPKDTSFSDNTVKDKSGIVMEIIPSSGNKPEWVQLGVSNIPVKIRKFKIHL